MSVRTIYDDYILLGYSRDFMDWFKKMNLIPPKFKPDEMERLKALRGEDV